MRSLILFTVTLTVAVTFSSGIPLQYDQHFGGNSPDFINYPQHRQDHYPKEIQPESGYPGISFDLPYDESKDFPTDSFGFPQEPEEMYGPSVLKPHEGYGLPNKGYGNVNGFYNAKTEDYDDSKAHGGRVQIFEIAKSETKDIPFALFQIPVEVLFLSNDDH